MKPLTRLVTIFLAMNSAIVLAQAPHFTYSGEHGPANWSELSPDYAACQAGRSQSPINISAAQEVDLPALDLEYSSLAVNFVNNGHAVQSNYAAGSTLDRDYHSNAPYHAHVNLDSGSTLGHFDSAYELQAVPFPFAQRAPGEWQKPSCRNSFCACRQ